MHQRQGDVQEPAGVRVLGISRIISLAGPLVLWAFAAVAQQPFVPISGDSLETPAGRLAIRKEGKPVCSFFDSCSVIRLGTQVLDQNWTAGLVGAYPSLQQPEFISYYTSGGGNCCLPGVAVVDVSSRSSFSLGGLFLHSNLPGPTVKAISPGLYELVGDNYERNKLGDRLPTAYLYDQKRKLVWEKPERGVPEYSDLVLQYPFEFLGDADRRKPLLRLIGEDGFAKFREHIGVAGLTSLESKRWLISHGCTPHLCTSSEGFFAIDLRTGKILAMQFDIDYRTRRPAIAIWSDVDPSTTPDLYGLRKAANEWLTTAGTKLAEGAGPFRLANSQASSSIGNSTPGAPAPISGPSPSSPGSWTNPNRLSQLPGPSFDCAAKTVSSQPLAQLICGSDELAYAELGYVIAYQAVRESSDPQARKAMVDEANALVVSLAEQCGIPKNGVLQRATNFEVSCIKRQFQQQRRQLIERAPADARDEAVLEPSETIAIQRNLQSGSYLPAAAAIDGVFGPVTRSAIVSWQRASGLRESGFGSKAMLGQSRGAPPVAISPTPGASAEPRVAVAEPPLQSMDAIDRTGKTNSIRLALNDGTDLRARDIFERVSGAVFVVQTNTTQGSAVAISEHELLTNCHVVRSAQTVKLEREGQVVQAKIAAANPEADRCVLRTETALPKWVKVRPYADVKVGEQVFTVGAPQGLELSIAEGIVSSKRTLDGARLIQTSAPISSGSSGGGLFDAQGNLIGITTFLLRNSQNLNFAIAAEEYAK